MSAQADVSAHMKSGLWVSVWAVALARKCSNKSYQLAKALMHMHMRDLAGLDQKYVCTQYVRTLVMRLDAMQWKKSSRRERVGNSSVCGSLSSGVLSYNGNNQAGGKMRGISVFATAVKQAFRCWSNRFVLSGFVSAPPSGLAICSDDAKSIDQRLA